MNTKLANTIDTIFTSLGLSYGLMEIKEILGIVILVINILWILGRFGYAVYTKIKAKNIEGLEEDVNKVVGELENIKDNLDKKEDKDNGKSN